MKVVLIRGICNCVELLAPCDSYVEYLVILEGGERYDR